MCVCVNVTCSMDIKVAEFFLLFVLFQTVFTVTSGNTIHSSGRIVYTIDQLLAFHNTTVLLQKRLNVPRMLRRRRCGNRAGALCRAKRR